VQRGVAFQSLILKPESAVINHLILQGLLAYMGVVRACLLMKLEREQVCKATDQMQAPIKAMQDLGLLLKTFLTN